MAIFTLEEAQSLVPEVKETTEYYRRQVADLKTRAEDTDSDERRRELVQQLNYKLSSWVEEMNGLGATVKGAWDVDFDSGDGIFYCWSHGDGELKYFHRYDQSCEERSPLENLKGSRF